MDDNCGNDCSNYVLSASVVGGADVDGVRRFGNGLRSARWSVEKLGRIRHWREACWPPEAAMARLWGFGGRVWILMTYGS